MHVQPHSSYSPYIGDVAVVASTLSNAPKGDTALKSWCIISTLLVHYKPDPGSGRVQTLLVVLFHCQNGKLSHFYNKFINNYSMVLKLSEMIIIVITNGL